MDLLSARHLHVTAGRTTLIHDISLTIKRPQLVALLGPNGAGKTSLLTTLAGLRSHKSGTITFADQCIDAWPTHRRVAAGLVYLPQHSALFASMSVYDNLLVVFDYHTFWQHKTREQFDIQAHELLQHVGLSDITARPAGVLSGGQKRKLELVRALLMQPKLLLCDEPFAGVDPKSIAELSALFEKIVGEQHISVLLSDHNVVQLLSSAHYVYMVLDGRVVTHGTPEVVREDAVTREQYLGQGF